MSDDKKIISLEIPKILYIKLIQEAKDKEMSTSALIRYIIKQYYTKNNNEI